VAGDQANALLHPVLKSNDLPSTHAMTDKVRMNRHFAETTVLVDAAAGGRIFGAACKKSEHAENS
jgi:hypothetical protein